ncbi:MAG: hypothetical protein LBD29_07965 [Treponema sp.]|nr:hypothetical protein [Treponema sp.]
MELNERQYRRIAGLLPVQRGNVKTARGNMAGRCIKGAMRQGVFSGG